ncbi:phosphotransferase family protein [Streptomyces sp. NPDC056716]|uniref:phosphotransferase family protein n=1 Tax=Streptomyces sp. NPDC056716 TaxID=3345922 RepID=UPI0036C99F02
MEFRLGALRRWLDANVDGGAGELSVTPIAGGRSNPTYEVTDGRSFWVLRRPPFGHVLPSAHDMGREFRVQAALRDSGVPVPRLVGLCLDESIVGAPFYVMDRLDGITLRGRDDAARLTPVQRARLADRMVDTLVRLHEVDPGAIGLAGWGRPDGYLERQLRRWSDQWTASRTRPRPQVDTLLRRLTQTLPRDRHPGIVHGDFKLDNMLLDRADPARVLGVLDWEMSTLGDTLSDLGILCSFWDEAGELPNPISAGATALDGFPGRWYVVERYGAARGIDITDLDWYLVFADFKIAVILEGIHARHLQGHTSGARFEGLDAVVDALLDRALARAADSSVAGLRS